MDVYTSDIMSTIQVLGPKLRPKNSLEHDRFTSLRFSVVFSKSLY